MYLAMVYGAYLVSPSCCIFTPRVDLHDRTPPRSAFFVEPRGSRAGARDKALVSCRDDARCTLGAVVEFMAALRSFNCPRCNSALAISLDSFPGPSILDGMVVVRSVCVDGCGDSRFSMISLPG